MEFFDNFLHLCSRLLIINSYFLLYFAHLLFFLHLLGLLIGLFIVILTAFIIFNVLGLCLRLLVDLENTV